MHISKKLLGSQFLVCFALTLFFLFFSFKLPRETFYGEGMLANISANTMIIIARAGQTLLKIKYFLICASSK
jgi:hypothetical protein